MDGFAEVFFIRHNITRFPKKTETFIMIPNSITITSTQEPSFDGICSFLYRHGSMRIVGYIASITSAREKRNMT